MRDVHKLIRVRPSAHFVATAGVQHRTRLQGGDLLERTRESGRLPGKLHRCRIRQEFTPTRYDGLQKSAPKMPIAPNTSRGNATTDTARVPTQQGTTLDPRRRQTAQQAHKTNVEAHIAIQDMA